LLQVRKVNKKFGGLWALQEVDMEVSKGNIFGLIGPNGAGKTTLFNVITGFYHCDSGNIQFEGKDITRKKSFEISRLGICRTFQIVKPFKDMTVLGNATIGALSKVRKVPEAMECARESLQVVGLADRQNILAGSLTVSDRKRLEIARALASQPRLLFLDEVMSGLRPTEVFETIDLIKKIHDFGITIVIIEHIMSAIMRLCDRIIVLHHGQKIGEGSPKEISKNDSVIQAYLGEDYIA